ncbi:MAG: aminoacyl-tRNA hydrolase [Saprospiraceae bacterium]|nr:MAG: aminoacyl-tRNA hydrolase [Saprospiraceae bacterium]
MELFPNFSRFRIIMDLNQLYKELNFRFSRSSGSGGQHVNKVSSQAELLFDIAASLALSEEEKQKINQSLAGRINQEGILSVRCSETRSQHHNKELTIRRLEELLRQALRPRPKRKKVKPRQTNPKARLKRKKAQAEKKALRKKIALPDS